MSDPETAPERATEVARRIRDSRFTPTSMRQGYDMGAVDELLDRLCAAASAGQPLGPLVAAARLPTTSFRSGYDCAEVDELLDSLAALDPPGGAAGSPAPTPDGTGDVADDVALIRGVRFTPVVGRRGYRMADVDALLDRLEEAVRARQPLAPVVAATRLATTRFRQGYLCAEVDRFLAGLTGPGPA